jgi:AcrR family transcriptional regulator
MNEHKNDRRVSRTKKALRGALHELIDEKDYDQITVEEITERANLGRTTFYLHYKDKEDLLLESFMDLIDEMLVKIARLPLLGTKLAEWGQNIEEAPVRAHLLIFQHVAENANLYRLVLRGQGTFKVVERLRAVIISAFSEVAHTRLENGLGLQLQVPLEVVANYYASALMGLIHWWLEKDMPYTPEEMRYMFQEMLRPAMIHVLGLDEKPAGGSASPEMSRRFDPGG